jgi:hypothetical protein
LSSPRQIVLGERKEINKIELGAKQTESSARKSNDRTAHILHYTPLRRSQC